MELKEKSKWEFYVVKINNTINEKIQPAHGDHILKKNEKQTKEDSAKKVRREIFGLTKDKGDDSPLTEKSPEEKEGNSEEENLAEHLNNVSHKYSFEKSPSLASFYEIFFEKDAVNDLVLEA